MKSKQNIHFLNEIIAKIMCENQSLKKTIGNSKEFLNSSGVRVTANGLQSNFLKTKFSAHELWRQKVNSISDLALHNSEGSRPDQETRFINFGWLWRGCR